jgi:hypothetical protein
LLTQRALRSGQSPPRATDPEEGETSSIYPFTKGITLVNDGVAYGERVSEKRYRPKECKLKQADVESWVGAQTRSGRRWDPVSRGERGPGKAGSKDGEE